jgi:hypothetical protein
VGVVTSTGKAVRRSNVLNVVWRNISVITVTGTG